MARTGRPREFDRDKAIDAAMNAFWERGFESTSLSDLRDLLNLSSASFYAAFGSKKSLYEECLKRYSETCGEVLEVCIWIVCLSMSLIASLGDFDKSTKYDVTSPHVSE